MVLPVAVVELDGERVAGVIADAVEAVAVEAPPPARLLDKISGSSLCP